MRSRYAFACLLGAVIPLLTTLSPAPADDHRPPETAVLKVNRTHQRGDVYKVQWIRRDDGFCRVDFRDDPSHFPAALSYRAGDATRVILRKNERPAEVEFRYWERVDADGNPQGSPTAIEFVLRPRKRDSRTVGWRVIFTPPRSSRNLYMEVVGYWVDEDGCGGDPDEGNQHVYWRFHLRRGA